MYKIDSRILGMVGTNCYLLCNMDIKECVLIDPADSQDEISRMIDESGCSLKGILLTHGHFDHIMAADAVRDKYGVKVYASCDEKNTLEQPHINLGEAYGLKLSVKADVWHKDGEILKLAGFDIEALHTPGHTEGGSCYYIREIGVLFSGDTLFCGSVGRTDFPGGSMSEIVRSIKEKVMVLPDDTKVYPGHGEGTSVGYERENTPFLVN
ncbi:MAG: MBL fold metallo-hydrolase [Lachnospira sp.]